MSPLKTGIALFALLALWSSTSHAQSSNQFLKTTYQVQVKYEMWRTGLSYWHTEVETSSADQAEQLAALYQLAIESGVICQILPCGVEWIVVDVRVRKKQEFPRLTRPWYRQR